uniref:Mannosyltransferase family protein n=1 Tax=Pseudomonas fluorescens TaxID=294 RepID=K9ZQP2_PSEFL|nr:mannosyltransferase family protein [Pseudomonas fluorescens]
MAAFWKNERGALLLLLGVTAVLLLTGLGARDLWGPETRWANIALQMLQSGDYFDPYLKGAPYYDKPLPSYWLVTASAHLLGGLGPWSLRLPSVIGAWLSVWLVYLIGEQLLRKGTGLIAGWMLATTFYFLFWARVATADVLTVCGVLAAVWWYWRGPEDTRLGRYTVFFLLLAVTSLFKGLIGFVLPGLVLLPHLLAEHRYKRHLNLRLVCALLIAAAVYAVPFVLSHVYGAPSYGSSGLALVFRENVVRFFDPFDHMGPIYTYLIYLPAYTLPWVPCWLLGLWLALRHWRHTPPNVRWLVWGLGLLFVFFTASGSRRSYYVLPLVPFAQLLGAWWVSERLRATASQPVTLVQGLRYRRRADAVDTRRGLPLEQQQRRRDPLCRRRANRSDPNRAVGAMATRAGGSGQQSADVPAKRRQAVLLRGRNPGLSPPGRQRGIPGLAGKNQRHGLRSATHDHCRAVRQGRSRATGLPGQGSSGDWHPAG